MPLPLDREAIVALGTDPWWGSETSGSGPSAGCPAGGARRSLARGDKSVAEFAQKIIQKLDDLGLNVSPRLDFMKYRTPADLENYAMAPGGSIYGSSSNSAISAFLRTKNRSKIKGLFCVGGSSHPGGGLPLVGISAEIVANAIGKA